MRALFLLSSSLLLLTSATAQQPPAIMDTTVFSRIARSIADYKVDTTTPPNDGITKAILELRSLRGGFNISEAILFKIEEDASKKDITVEQAAGLRQYFSAGNGKRWLDNAVIWIYRSQFTHKQLKGLVKFYRSDAGQKMADVFPIVMVQTLAAAEKVKAMCAW